MAERRIKAGLATETQHWSKGRKGGKGEGKRKEKPAVRAAVNAQLQI